MNHSANNPAPASSSLLLLLLLLIAAPLLAFGQQQPRTILDYYLLLPQRYLRYAGGETREARQSSIYIRDVEHNYLQVRQPNGEFYTALALFKGEDGSHLVAVENRECARGCNEEFFLLRYENELWTDVTSKTLPVIDDNALRARMNQQFDGHFAPRVLHQLAPGGKFIEVLEYWSGISLGQLEWAQGAFTFVPLAAQSTAAASENVLASVNNAAGDRLQILGVTPEAPARLPLQGHFNIRIAYELKSAATAHIFVEPVIGEQFLRDSFNGGSMTYERGSGVRTAYLGFFNEARLNQVKVMMVDEQRKELLTLTFNVDATWEGTLACPTFHVSCFPNAANPSAPFSCHAIPSGLSGNERLTYRWSLPNGVIINGQGTRHINYNLTGTAQPNATVTVEVEGLPAKCTTTTITANLPPAASTNK